MWQQLLDNGRSAFSERWPGGVLVPAAVGVGGVLVCWMLCGRKRKTIEMGDGWWGHGERPRLQIEDTSLRPFRIEVSDADLQDLYERLDHTRFSSPLDDSKFHYGFNSTHLRKVVSYWRNQFDWPKQVEILNKYPHYKTTIEGCALNDSPVGLAAYILEKFSTWTDNKFRDLQDGGLERKYSLDDLLTNVMIYWLTGSITSSMRFYKENFPRDYARTSDTKIGVYVPTGLAAFPCELMHAPRTWAKQKFRNIVTYTYMPSGGHFAALEEPELLARDVQNFVSRVEKI
ncbi:epoxide hydrolase 1-like isoform X2 [Ascaphus truei]|uniref:epoxide hydrolase 1-like isoform X2 n=1 Tax=Ascaphus truei TaxID=8439 RepID=UPI003F59043B